MLERPFGEAMILQGDGKEPNWAQFSIFPTTVSGI
jgi:hypothetical protein